MLIESAALVFVGLGAAVILLPDSFQNAIVGPAGACLVLGSVLWIFVMRGAARSREELSATLERRDQAERELARSEEQLRQAQKFQAVGRLAGGVAHDFNHLLQVIRGYGELAQIALKRGDDPCREVEEIVAVADRAADLTGQLLAFSRRQVLHPSTLDLNEVVGDMNSLLRMLVGDAIEVEVPRGHADVCVNFDRGQLERIITNLAVNAKDAMPRGGRLSLETGRAVLGPDHGFDDPPRQFALLAVTDTGAGMDAETAAQIFEPFFTTKREGTGLGLATVHGIVTQSGGSIWVYSELGEGTTFKVYLPLAEEVQVPRKAQPTAVEGDGLGETVLLVDDDAQLRGIVARMLEGRGYRVVRASGGEEALRLANGDNGRIDLVLSDLMMPGLGGRDLVGRVRELQPTASVLYMSGYTDDAAVRRGVLDQSAAFIEKPFSSDELAGRVRELIDGAVSATESADAFALPLIGDGTRAIASTAASRQRGSLVPPHTPINGSWHFGSDSASSQRLRSSR